MMIKTPSPSEVVERRRLGRLAVVLVALLVVLPPGNAWLRLSGDSAGEAALRGLYLAVAAGLIALALVGLTARWWGLPTAFGGDEREQRIVVHAGEIGYQVALATLTLGLLAFFAYDAGVLDVRLSGSVFCLIALIAVEFAYYGAMYWRSRVE